MKKAFRILVPLLALLCIDSRQALAQWPQHFFVGSYFVRCDLDIPHELGGFPHYVQGLDSSIWIDENEWHMLPARRFDQIEDLGLDLAEITIDHPHLFSPPPPPRESPGNVVSDLNQRINLRVESGHADLTLCISDPELQPITGAERLMFHPEGSSDYLYVPIGFQEINDAAFIDYPVNSLHIDNQLGSLTGSKPNCRTLAAPGVISGVTNDRRRELSVCRRYIVDQNIQSNQTRDVDTTEGKYHLSIVLRAPNTIQPSSTNPVLRVKLFGARDSVQNQRDSLAVDVPGSAFLDAFSAPHDTVFEYHLGLVELRVDSIDPTNARVFHLIDWSENPGGLPMTNDSSRMNATNIEPGELNSGMLDLFDISIEYLQGTSGTIHVDAVCLSSPGGFALFQPGAPNLEPGYRAVRYRMDRTLTALLRDSQSALHEHVRLLTGAEQDWNSGAWRASKLVSHELEDESGGNVLLYCATSAWSDTSRYDDQLMDLTDRIASGYYYYPIHWTLPTPRQSQENYYTLQYEEQPNGPQNMWFMAERFNRFADARKKYQMDDPWIPYIQNQGQSYPDSLKWDGDRLREPTAAELRLQCNLAIGHGADGIMFYLFSSRPYRFAHPLFWPTTRQEWLDDTTFRDDRMGEIGFLGAGNAVRNVDMNGEGKWDSTRVTVAKSKLLGQIIIDSSLAWDCSRPWYSGGVGSAVAVNEIVSMRQDAPTPLDEENARYVITSEFTCPTGSRFIFVVNGRTDVSGQRHITVKLAPGETDEWKVTNMLTGDIWIVKPSDTPDNSSIANGFTEYFEPGAAALYRLEPITDQHVSFKGSCLAGSIHIEPAATLHTDNTDDLRFSSGHGVYCQGRLIAHGTTFTRCSGESDWDGIITKDGASAYLDNIRVHYASVIAGPAACDTLTEGCRIDSTTYALQVFEGALVSSGTVSRECSTHLWSMGESDVALTLDDAAGAANSQQGVMVFSSAGGTIAIDECEFEGYQTGLSVIEGYLTGDVDAQVPQDFGNNSIHATSVVLEASNNSDMELGYWANEANNDIDVFSPSGYHAITDGTSSISAQSDWWGKYPPVLRIIGSVDTRNPLMNDPVLFTSSGGASLISRGSALQKSAATPSPSTIGEQVRLALAQRQHHLTRHLIGQFLLTPAAVNADDRTLRLFHRALRAGSWASAIDSLLTFCLARQDLRSKLLAADIVRRDARFADALAILNSYSFAGSTQLLNDALLRKTLCYPRAWQGGYAQGLRALDSLRVIPGNDSLYANFFTMYPVLFSGLRHPRNTTSPRQVPAVSIMERVLPVHIDIGQNYPNPFRTVTSFTFKLPDTRHVRLQIFDALGRAAAEVANGVYDRGVHSEVFEAGPLHSGIYYYRFTAGDEVVQKQMLLLR